MDPQLLRGWRRDFVADGVVLSPPEREGVARIRIRPRLAPLRSVRSLVAEFLTPPGAHPAEIEGPLGLTTAEGEYAALVNEIVGPVQRTAAFVMGDDWFAGIDAVTGQPALFPQLRRAVEQLAHGHCLGLGSDRWRRFFYDPPAGWSGIGRGRSVAWIPPDCPRNPAVIRVYDARPLRSTGPMLLFRRLFEQLPREYGELPPGPTMELYTREHLRGELVTFRLPGSRGMACDAVLSDVRYVYLLRLESDEAHFADASALLAEVIESVRPLPLPSEADSLVARPTSELWSE